MKIIARRNRQGHYCLPRKDTTVCGIVYERVMFDSGCNTILLPFPEERKRSETLQPFYNERHRWEISWSNETGGINCPTLKIHPQVLGDIGVMKFGEDYESRMPFLQFHLGLTQWLIRNPPRLDGFNVGKLIQFLGRMGDNIAVGRKTAIVGQMLLGRLCVMQGGITMCMVEAEDVAINPLRLSNECVRVTNEIVEEYGEILTISTTTTMGFTTGMESPLGMSED